MRPIDYDRDQDLIALYNQPAAIKRRVHELHGMAAAVVYDGDLTDAEIRLVRDWMAANLDLAREWPISDLYALLVKILQDRFVTHAERVELFDFLYAMAADPARYAKPAESIFDAPTSVPVVDRTFLFTGRLSFGSRKMAEGRVIALGGEVLSSPAYSLDHLVVGDLGSAHWSQSRYGTKIKRVMEHRADGAPTLIIDERTFVTSVIGGE